MAKVLDIIYRVFDRRKIRTGVVADRRARKISVKEAEQCVDDAMDRLDRTVRLRQDDLERFLKGENGHK